jgi:ABC-2 type transport system ATP-binding protein
MTALPLQIKNLSKTIRGKSILRNVSFDVNQGEIFGLLGPNGAGKTTLFRLITNLTAPSNGCIYINGINVNLEHVRAANHIGAIIETPHMYPFLTAYKNLVHFSLYSNQKPDETNIMDKLALVGLKEVANDKVKTFSLGMKQRLGLAQSLLHNPDLILLDEPTNGMDPMGIKAFREHLHHLTKEKNKTVVISSHLLNEMEFLCDRVAFMMDGEVIAVERVQNDNADRDIIRIEVDQVERATILMSNQEMGIQLFDVEGDTLVFLLQRDEISELLSLLIHHQIKVFGVQAKKSSLEDRFMRMIKEASVDTVYKSRAT